jgi:hypothetical protein
MTEILDSFTKIRSEHKSGFVFLSKNTKIQLFYLKMVPKEIEQLKKSTSTKSPRTVMI